MLFPPPLYLLISFMGYWSASVMSFSLCAGPPLARWSGGKFGYLSVGGIALMALLAWISLTVDNSTSPPRSIWGLAILGAVVCLPGAVFAASGILPLFIFFELSSIPMAVLILTFGYQPERLGATLYFLFYTSSLGLGLLFMMVASSVGGLCPGGWGCLSPPFLGDLLTLLALMAFLVKIPLFMTHVWLPKAHLEAPVYGSVLLAGIYLKLGIFGMMQLSMESSEVLFPLLGLFSLGGGAVIALSCLFQSDMKRIIALSSVVHLAFSICSILSGAPPSDSLSVIMCVGHGLSSSFLFFLNHLIYTAVRSRSLILSAGAETGAPLLASFMFLGVALNLSFPFSLSLMSEVIAIPLLEAFGGSLASLCVSSVLLNLLLSVYMYSAIKGDSRSSLAKGGIPGGFMSSTAALAAPALLGVLAISQVF